MPQRRPPPRSRRRRPAARAGEHRRDPATAASPTRGAAPGAPAAGPAPAGPAQRRNPWPRRGGSPGVAPGAGSGRESVVSPMRSHEHGEQHVLWFLWIPARRGTAGRGATGGARRRRRERRAGPDRAPGRRERGRDVPAPGRTRRRPRNGRPSSPATATSRPRHATFTPGGPAALRQGRGLAQRRLQEARAATSPSAPTRTTSSASGRGSSSSSRSRPRPPTADGVERLGSSEQGLRRPHRARHRPRGTGNAFPIPETGIHLGRERGDISFPEDGYVSGLHCRLSWDGQCSSSPISAARTARSSGITRGGSAHRRRAAHGPAAVPRSGHRRHRVRTRDRWCHGPPPA